MFDKWNYLIYNFVCIHYLVYIVREMSIFSLEIFGCMYIEYITPRLEKDREWIASDDRRAHAAYTESGKGSATWAKFMAEEAPWVGVLTHSRVKGGPNKPRKHLRYPP